jgi:protein-histidine pros-kinase
VGGRPRGSPCDQHPEHAFREASLNPLNPANRADEDEETIIRNFISNTDLAEQSGFRERDGREHFSLARPTVVEKACLRCHDTPERAPREVVARHGRGHGFGRKEGDRISAAVASVPTEDLRVQQSDQLRRLCALFTLGGLLLSAGLALASYSLIHRRLERATALLQEVSANPTTRARLG